LELDRGSELPLQEQLERALREDIRLGRLLPGARLPSTRGLAAQLRISRGVVSAAYGQLAAEGYVITRQGASIRVARAIRPHRPPAAAPSLAPGYAYDFRPGVPDLARFPRDRWLRSLRTALRDSRLSAIGYGDPRGAPELRDALAGYTARVRGAVADPEHLLVCAGFMQAFSLVCRWLRAHGIARVALEDPGWHPHRLIVEQAGLEVVPVACDAAGVDIDALTAGGAPVVVLTPSHQFPTGAVLKPDRRAALIEWAEREERLIIEDDYDSELRYDGGAVGALQGLAPERVLYIGSASKRLAPGLRLGWMLMPSWLAFPLITAKAAEDGGSEVTGQLALADFIARGELDRHLRRMRLSYQRRRAGLLDELARMIPAARPSGAAAGLFELVALPDAVDEPALVSAAAERGVGLEGLGLHRYAADGPPGLVLGFASLPEPAMRQGVRLAAAALSSVDR
jgi:GntR family transcriptional regulator/MocR family aminotransferase